MTPAPALLISLPSGLTLGGVQVWAARLLSELARRGRPVGIILHPPEAPPLDLPLHPRVNVYNITATTPLRSCNGDLSPYRPTYQHAIDDLYAATNQPVVCIPCHLGDSAGLFASLTQLAPHKLRLAGWCHSDIPYDLRVLDYYQPILTHTAAVSDHLTRQLCERFPKLKVWNIANAVPTGNPRPRYNTARPRLIFLGRFDRDIKRVLALPTLSQELTRLGVTHQLTIVGDGPAAPDLARAAAALDNVTILPTTTPAHIAELLADHDIFVLPSRVEGLSLAMLEAMAAGCVPVVTRTESGAGQVIDSTNGLIVDAPADADEPTVGLMLARAIAGMLHRLPQLSAAAITTISTRYSLTLHANQAERFIDAAAASPALSWPPNIPASFTAPNLQGSGAVPPEGERRLRTLLSILEGRRLIIHGTGRHTIELTHVLTQHRAQIAAFTDDDPARQGQRYLDLPILAPQDASQTRATDVIISSWMNQDLIYQRRAVYESQAMKVHRLYAPDPEGVDVSSRA